MNVLFWLMLSYIGCLTDATPVSTIPVSPKEEEDERPYYNEEEGLYIWVNGDWKEGLVQRNFADGGRDRLYVFINKAKCLERLKVSWGDWEGYCVPLKDMLALQRLEGDIWE